MLDDVIKAEVGLFTFFNVITKDKSYKLVGGLFGKKKWVELINKQV